MGSNGVVSEWHWHGEIGNHKFYWDKIKALLFYPVKVNYP